QGSHKRPRKSHGAKARYRASARLGVMRESRATAVFLADEGWRMGQIGALALAVVRIQSVVDGDLITSANVAPGVDVDAAANRDRAAWVGEVAACGQQDAARLEIQLAQVSLILLRQRRDLAIPDDLAMPAAEDEVATREVPPRKDAF